jgi:sphingomyelin phosphodiesterase acid-like 3
MKMMYPLLFVAVWLFAIACQSNEQVTTKPVSNADTLVNASYGKAIAPHSFLFISDIHLGVKQKLTKVGSRNNGDTYPVLWKNYLLKLDAILGSAAAPDYIVYTGDLPAHYRPNQPYLDTNISTVLNGLRNLATKYGKPLFYVPGNNDGLAADYASFANSRGETPLSLVTQKSNNYPALNIRNDGTAPCMVSNPHPTMGYYSARPIPGLRLICLNTVMYTDNYYVADSTSGTAAYNEREDQMEWLCAQLADAENRKEKVYLAMHVPPGIDAYGISHGSAGNMWAVPVSTGQPYWLNQFLSLTTRYQNAIAGILYGHTHMDEIRRLYDTTGTMITDVAISCPGVSVRNGNFPGFKTVTYDPLSMELLDFTTYYTNDAINWSWGNLSYTFSSQFKTTPNNNSILQQLRSMDSASVTGCANKIYTVMNGSPGYSLWPGIEVKSDPAFVNANGFYRNCK